MSDREIREGDIFSYRPARTWCRHGSAIVNKDHAGNLYAQDTYWNGLSDRRSEYGWVSFDLLKAGEYIGNREDFRNVSRHEYSTFSQQDRFYLPVGGGSEAYYVRKDATPDGETAVEFLREKIREEESAIRCSQYRIAEYQKEIDTHTVGK